MTNDKAPTTQPADKSQLEAPITLPADQLERVVGGAIPRFGPSGPTLGLLAFDQ